MQQGQQSMGTAASNPMAMKILQAKTEILESVNWLLIIGCFLFYFLGGYLFYASLFAAVGSVIDEDPQEAQALMLPITMPIIFSFVILGSVLSNPGSSIAIWTSILPFTSPIIMMGRIPFGVPSTVPYWQLAASMLSLIGGFLLTTWFAGKIYRTGILMYGKKVTWKEIIWNKDGSPITLHVTFVSSICEYDEETDSILYDCKRRRLENEEFINIVLDKETEEGEII
jgi:ABC-2 type transport system permease protein